MPDARRVVLRDVPPLIGRIFQVAIAVRPVQGMLEDVMRSRFYRMVGCAMAGMVLVPVIARAQPSVLVESNIGEGNYAAMSPP